MVLISCIALVVDFYWWMLLLLAFDHRAVVAVSTALTSIGDGASEVVEKIPPCSKNVLLDYVIDYYGCDKRFIVNGVDIIGAD